VKRAAIFIDGKNYGITPFDQFIEVSVGTHQITLTRDRYTPVSQTVTVGDGEDVSFHGDLWLKDPPATWKGYLGWTSVGLGVAATAGGYLLGVYAPIPETLYTGTAEYEMWVTRQTALYAAGGGLAGMGILLVILDAMDKQMVDPDDTAQAPSMHLHPAVVQDGLGAIFHGSF
ncbi:MAG: PEGA domain-containing protein, partial [Myxococcota bacterium]|nr:PEGA domain-containing protein [Myxococcota bacterium]